ncbi:hypothetical protein OOJ91_13800 [Micromonospora lupini]|uniref:hypothetical protein n=1 Tax=Micromonospora lupini TaxID=285679 RepID=UPI00224E3C92|nr:hypothetical protein [Micromonospora lupini]MCX5066921.1 hypothetical protein [Micromonospora lupini]
MTHPPPTPGPLHTWTRDAIANLATTLTADLTGRHGPTDQPCGCIRCRTARTNRDRIRRATR